MPRYGEFEPVTAGSGNMLLDVLDSFADDDNSDEIIPGPPVPDPVTFVLSSAYLDRGAIVYPRQMTLMKLIFLRTDLMTEYDHEVIASWIQMFYDTNPEGQDGEKFSDDTNGIQPDIYVRIQFLRERGYRWFREVILAMGRRAGKGYICALAMAYVLWNYLGTGNPQQYYGIDAGKQIACAIFAGKRDQAIENLWGDLNRVLTEAPCFTRYISNPLGQSLTIYAPHDEIRLRRQAGRGIYSTKDQATFRVIPRESIPLSARGPAGAILGFDEAAHVTSTGVTRAFGDVYKCLDPATRVLCSDLTWKPISEIHAGDLLIGIDEEHGDGQQRKLREAKVLSKWVNRSPALRLTFDDGSSVVCSPNHRWLKVSSSKSYWVPAGLTPEQECAQGHFSHLKAGDRIRFLAEPWDFDNSHGAGYLAGIFDGEGHIVTAKTTRKCEVSFTQLPGAVLDQSVNFLEDRGYEPVIRNGGSGTRVKIVNICGQAEALRFLGSIRPVRLLNFQRTLWEGRSLAKREGTRMTKTIVSIEQLPARELVDIQTTTGTFIAEGLISHNSATPSLGQFGRDGFICIPSSTWEMIGKFYELWDLALQTEPASGGEGRVPAYWNKFMLQLTSWDIYLDWERAPDIPLFPEEFEGDLGEYKNAPHPRLNPLRGAIESYDEEMQKEEQADPDTFRVERRSGWQTALDAYLNKARIDDMFAPWEERDPEWGPPQLEMQKRGLLIVSYRAHGDPSEVNNRFGFAVAHQEQEAPGLMDQATQLPLWHCVFDLIHFWDPKDFPDHMVDYDEIIDWIFNNVVLPFQPEELTFDQFNSAASVPKLQKEIRASPRLQKNVSAYIRTATAPLNWQTAQTFKAALNMRLVHAPLHQEARDELRFLQKPEGQQKVIAPTSGPVQTKDIADCIMIITHELLGEQMNAFLRRDLANQRPAMAMGRYATDPYQKFDPGEGNPYADQLGTGLARGMRPGMGAGRLPRASRRLGAASLRRHRS